MLTNNWNEIYGRYAGILDTEAKQLNFATYSDLPVENKDEINRQKSWETFAPWSETWLTILKILYHVSIESLFKKPIETNTCPNV